MIKSEAHNDNRVKPTVRLSEVDLSILLEVLRKELSHA